MHCSAHAISSHDLAEELERLVSHHILRLVRQTPNYVTFEAKSSEDAQACSVLLNNHEPQLLEVAGSWYVIASLSY